MKIFRLSTILSVCLAVLSGAVLFLVSQNVQQAEDKLRSLEKAGIYEGKTIRVLRAEWDYLNRPERLEALASEYLELVPPDALKIIDSGSALPEPVIPAFPTRKPSFIEYEEASFRPPLLPASSSSSPPHPSHKPSSLSSHYSTNDFLSLLRRYGQEKERDE